jgi:putative endonuclease
MPYFVYITTTKNNTAVYVGITNDLKRRVAEHKLKLISGFTKRFNVNKLVFYEMHDQVEEAIKREKQIKSGSRQKKIDLIRRMNQRWEDLTKKL